MDKTILVVDDEELIRNVLVDFFAEHGFLVYESGDGPEAIKIVERETPALLLLDLRLIKMSGLEVLKRAKKISPKTCVIMLSGSQEEAQAKEAIRLGAYDYLTKPISLEILQVNIIDRLYN